MGIGNQYFYVIEEFISWGTLKEETFAISQIFALSAKVYSAKVLKNYDYAKFSAFLLTFLLSNLDKLWPLTTPRG